MFAISTSFKLSFWELAIFGGLGLLILFIVLAVIFLASRGSSQDRRRDED
jgi:hypothetical protein